MPKSRRTAALIVAVAVTAGALGVAEPAGAQDPTSTTTEPTTTTAAPTTTVPPAPPAPTSLPLSGPDLAEGMSGAEVAFLQIRLLERGYWLSDPFGRFGASTRHALTAFQKYHLLPRSGRLDAISRFILAATVQRPTVRFPKPGRSIEVDIARQVLLVAQDGNVIVVLDVSTGTRSTPTPRGSFRITRQINGLRISRLGQLWRPKYFTGGYALHGSPSVPNYPASHGCVRLTNQEINFLWDSGLAPVGTPVTLY